MRLFAVTALLPLLCVVLPTHAAAPEQSAKPVPPPSLSPSQPPAVSHPPAVGPIDGLSEDEAVLRALQGNPALRAFRKQRAVAEGEIVSATALENPRLQLQMVHFQEAANMGWTATVKWAPPMPAEWLAKRSQARARVDQVRYEIAEQEWAVATLVRATHATILELRDQARILDEALALRRRMAALMRTRVQRGGATRIELNLVDLAALGAQRDLHAIALRRTQAQSQLQALLGVLSTEPIGVQGPLYEDRGGLARLDPAKLAEQALVNRPVLKAAQARISQRQHALRVEKVRRFPWLELSARYGQTGSSKYPNDWQVGVELPLPILNWNSGPVRVAAAELDEEQATEQAQTEALKQSVYAAHAELKLRRDILLHYVRDVLPVFTEHERLLEVAVRGGQIDLVALLSSEDSVLRGRREYSDARLSFRQAWLALEAAVGARLHDKEAAQ